MWYWILKRVGGVIFGLLFRLSVEGLDNLPQKTNFIIVANHFSLLDPVVISAVFPKRTYYVALRELYAVSWLGWLMKTVNVLPTGDASEKATCLLMNNKNICLFPEGGISRDGALREFRRGAAMLALKTGRPIVPCAILGTYEALPRGARFPHLFRSLKVKIGKPQYLLKEFDELIDDVRMQEGISKVKNIIKEMLYAR